MTLWQIPVKPFQYNDSIILVMAETKEEAIEKVKDEYKLRTHSSERLSPNSRDKVYYERTMPFGRDIAYTWI